MLISRPFLPNTIKHASTVAPLGTLGLIVISFFQVGIGHRKFSSRIMLTFMHTRLGHNTTFNGTDHFANKAKTEFIVLMVVVTLCWKAESMGDFLSRLRQWYCRICYAKTAKQLDSLSVNYIKNTSLSNLFDCLRLLCILMFSSARCSFWKIWGTGIWLVAIHNYIPLINLKTKSGMTWNPEIQTICFDIHYWLCQRQCIMSYHCFVHVIQ